MLYDIVLKNGQELMCFEKDKTVILENWLKGDIAIVQENNKPQLETYIKREDISYIRLAHEGKEYPPKHIQDWHI